MQRMPPMPQKDDCRIPFTDCWCASRPNNPHCEKATLDINLDIVLILSGLILIVFFYNKSLKNICK